MERIHKETEGQRICKFYRCVWNILTAILAYCTEYGVRKSPNIRLLHNQSMVLYLYKRVGGFRPLRHSSRFPATALTTSLTRKTFSSFHAQSSFYILILSTPWHTCIIMSLRGTKNITTHASYIRPHPWGWTSIFFFFFFTVALDCTHVQVWINRQLKLLNPLKPELNPICYLLALLAHHFLHVSRIRVKSLTFRSLTLYIYIY